MHHVDRPPSDVCLFVALLSGCLGRIVGAAFSFAGTFVCSFIGVHLHLLLS
jgi:hypothetical protein